MLGIEDPSEQKNRPSGSAFKQQKLPAWQPILTAGTVLPTFFLIGIAFIPIGFGLLMSSNQVREKKIEYTHCPADQHSNISCAEIIEKNPGADCTCTLKFTLEEDFERDVYIYYGLTNFYQNHRRYVKSRDDKQLLGHRGNPSSDCEPFAWDKDHRPIVPCGAIANSLFNDTFELWRYDPPRQKPSAVPVVITGIAWATDKNSKFKNPPGDLEKTYKDSAKPPNWQKKIWNLDTNKANNGFQNEALIIWMRTAALPTFRKLYGRINHSADDPLRAALPRGTYTVKIRYSYPVTSFKGTKRIIISNTSWLGGKNPFLGIAYITVGFVCLLLSGLFLFIHRRFGKSTSELLHVTARTPYLSSS